MALKNYNNHKIKWTVQYIIGILESISVFTNGRSRSSDNTSRPLEMPAKGEQ